MTARASVRGVIVDESDRVLLLKWRRPADGEMFWLCPGGGVEPGEDDAAALRRELLEETGLRGIEPGPHVATWRWSNGYEHRFYLVRCASFEPATTEGHPAYEVFAEYRWWSADELPDCVGLGPEPHAAEFLARILRGDTPDAPEEWHIDP